MTKLLTRATLGGCFEFKTAAAGMWCDMWLSDFGDRLRLPKRFKGALAKGRPTRALVRWANARHREACVRWQQGRAPIRQEPA